MRCKHALQITVLIPLLVTIAFPLAIGAQQEDTQLPVLLSTGLPSTDTPEDLLPSGATAYLRFNNLQVLLENIDSLLTTFVPEKALPPGLQPIFEQPQPFLALIGTQMFGQPVGLNEISNLIGIALDSPVSLAFYPMEPDKGFVLSIPVAHPTVVTGMIQSMLIPQNIEKGTVGTVTYYRVTPSNPDVPPEVYIVASDKRVFLCGSFDLLQVLVNSENMEHISADPVIEKGMSKYGDHDLTLMLSPGFIKPQLPLLRQEFAQALMPFFQQLRREITSELSPTERFMIDVRLRVEFGIDGLDQLVDYVEAYSSGLYNVLLDELVHFLTNLDGLALGIDLEEQFQHVALSVFSQNIQPENFTRVLALDDIKYALETLPGDKSTIVAVGQTAEAKASKLLTTLLNAIEQELQNKGLPTEAFLAYKEFYLTRQSYASLESKVDWTLKTLISLSEETDFSQFTSLWELLKYALDRLSSGPLFTALRLMPSVEEGVIENHFADKATTMTQNGQLHQTMREKLPFKPPFFTLSGRFHQEDAGADVKKLVLEKVYTTRRGFFGYQQHELINRKMMFHKKLADYEILYDAGIGTSETLFDEASAPVPGAALKLLDQAPQATTSLSLFRTLHMVAGILDVLTGVEDVIHRELDTFLLEVQDIVDTDGEEEIEFKLLETGLDLPLLIASLNLDQEGNVYCTLPRGLYYPRPHVIPKVKELFTDFLTEASEIGGSASFIAVQPNEIELSSVQSMEALAFLVKTVVNNFYATYMSSPEGMNVLMTTLAHPKDFQEIPEEVIFENPLWEVILEASEEVLQEIQ